jgi:peptidylprolyl isomerase
MDPHRAAQNGYQPIVFQAGRKDGMIPGFIEGLEKLAIGDKSAVVYTFSFSLWRRRLGDVIPNTNIILKWKF